MAMAATIATAVGAYVTGSAHAQSMDYGALEQLFGEPVTTSATGSPQRASDVPANMEIITADAIRRSGADNIPDILQFTTGVDVRRYGFATAEISVRGYNQQASPRLLVLINGRQVYLDDYGRTAWQVLPVQISEIRQIEIVRGPNSALFGFNAVGGVINIITYDAGLDSTNTISIRAGTQDYAGGSAVMTLHDGDTAGLRLSAGGFRANEFSTSSLPAGLGPYNHAPYQFAFSADGDVRLAPNVILTAEATATGARNFEVLPLPDFADDRYRTDSGKLGLVADTRFGLAALTAYRNESTMTSQAVGTQVTVNTTIYVARADDLIKLGSDHTVRLGVEFRDNSLSGASFGGRIGYSLFAASGMWNWQIMPELALSNAVRLDHLALNFTGAPVTGSRYTTLDYNSARLTGLSFNSGLAYKPTDSDTLRLLVARGIQSPSLVDFGLQSSSNVNGLQVSFVGNPMLDEASVINYELDYDRNIPAINATLRTAAYYQQTSNLLASALNTPFERGAGGVVSYSQNVGDSAAAGGEFELKGTTDSGIRWNINYALVSIADRLTIDPLSGGASILDYAHGTPTSMVNVSAGYSWDRFEVDGQARWQSHFTDVSPVSTLGSQPIRIDNYLTVNARAAYHITDGMTLALTGQQLTQSHILEAAGIPVERRITAILNAAL
jgi:iron complex outermembrane receptor protein